MKRNGKGTHRRRVYVRRSDVPPQGNGAGSPPALVPFEKYDALVQMVAQMKREGFTVPGEVGKAPMAPELPTVVRRAIAEIGSDNPLLEQQLVQTAWAMLAQGLEAGAVAKKILVGEPLAL